MSFSLLKILYFLLGTLSLGLGIVGIALPGLPTTPFLLLAAALYFKSSRRLYGWLMNHKIFGSIIRNFRENGTIGAKQKFAALSIMIVMISFSVFFILENIYIRIGVFILGLIGIYVVSSIPVERKKT